MQTRAGRNETRRGREPGKDETRRQQETVAKKDGDNERRREREMAGKKMATTGVPALRAQTATTNLTATARNIV